MISSYRTIFRSTALVGGATLWNIVIGIVRTKVVAVALGPTGYALTSLYQSVGSLVATLTGLGLTQAGTREIADATGTGDAALIGRTVSVVEWAALGSGVLGAALLAALAVPLSWLTFDSGDHAMGLAVSALAILFGAVAGAYTSTLQGLRHMRKLAAAQVWGSLGGSLVSVVFVLTMGVASIPWLLVGSAAVTLVVARHYRRQVIAPAALPSWAEARCRTRSLLRMGVAFLVSGLLVSVVAYLTRMIVVQSLGLEAAGLYAATWALSSLYVGVILSAMGADFYPRLAAVSRDSEAVNRMVNEQTEMGILLGLPGVLATIVLAPWILRLLYSADFAPAAVVVHWQALGVALRIVSWPLGFVQLAKGMPRVFMATELAFSALQVGLLLACGQLWGLEGLGVSFALTYLAYTIGMRAVCARLTQFRWSARTRACGVSSILVCGVCLISVRLIGGALGTVFASVVGVASSVLGYLELRRLLGGPPLRVLAGR